MTDLDDLSFDELVSFNNDYNDYMDKDFYICYKNEFDDYVDQLDPDENPSLRVLRSKLKDVFWIDAYGKLHTTSFANARIKMLKILSTSKARRYLDLD